MIRWLHISDLHFKTKRDPDQQNMRNAILRACINGEVKADFVVATGDFHKIEDTNNFESAKDFLVELSFALGIDIKSDFFLVPGNHDLMISAQRNQKINEVISSKVSDGSIDYVIPLTEKDGTIQLLLSSFDGYSIFAQKLISTYDPHFEKALDPKAVHIRVWDKKINILHLNTAILSNKDRDHFEAVDIATACSSEISKVLDNGLPTLVLGHHSFFDLHASIRERLIQLFNQTNVWAYLAGDKHRINYFQDDYLIDRKIGVSVWPNIVAPRTSTDVNDRYSDFGIVRYCWDENKNIVTPEYLKWERNSSGFGFTWLGGDSVRPFPMYASIKSGLFYDLVEKLQETRKKHPSFQLMEVDETLYPKGFISFEMAGYRAKYDDNSETRTIAEFFRESWCSSVQNHIMIEGEGGIGKTVALLSLALDNETLPHNVPAIYIPLNALKQNEHDNSISVYIREEILRGNRSNFEAVIDLANLRWEISPRIILLLDGFNEIPINARYSISRDIEQWSRKQGVQIVTSSRFDIRNVLSGLEGQFRAIKLQPLSREIIADHLIRNKISLPQEDSAIWEVINYPLMLTLYTQTEMVKTLSCDVPLAWRTENNAGCILWNYLQQEILRNCRLCKQPSDIINCVLLVEFIAPYIAWEMVQSQRFTLTGELFEEYITKALCRLEKTNKSLLPKQLYSVLWQLGGAVSWPDRELVYSTLTQNLNLFRIQEDVKGRNLKLMHQNFRDFLAALWMINISPNLRIYGLLPEEWIQPIDGYVLNYISDVMSQEDADFLWEINRLTTFSHQNAIRNMFELQKRKRGYDYSKLNFSGLDFRGISLHKYRPIGELCMKLPKDCDLLNRCIFDEHTFEPEGHLNGVQAITITPDDKYCISGSFDQNIIIWDLLSGAPIKKIYAHDDGIGALKVTLDGRSIISASLAGTVKIWDVATGVILHTINRQAGDNLALIPDGKRFISDSLTGTLKMWDIISGELLRTYVGHEDIVTRVIITPDGNYILSASTDNTVRLWDLENSRPIKIYKEHTGIIWDIAVTSDGKRVVSASEDHTLRVWDLQSEECLHVLVGHNDIVRSVLVTPDNKYCISASGDCTIRIWDINCGDMVRVLQDAKGVFLLTMVDNGDCFLSTSLNGTIKKWETNTGLCKCVFEGHSQLAWRLAFRASGDRFISGSHDCSLREWRIDNGTCIRTFQGSNNWINSIRISSNGEYCICATENNSVRVWDLNKGTCTKSLLGHKGGVTAALFVHNDTRCVTSSWDGTIKTWDLKSAKNLKTFFGHTDSIRTMILTRDGMYCISASNDNTLRLWNIENGICEKVFQGHTSPVNDIAVSEDGRFCISASSDETLRVWDINSGVCLNTLLGHTMYVNKVSIIPGSNRCVSAADDGSLRVWDFKTGECIYELLGHKSLMINDVTVSLDGSKCVSACDDKLLIIWDLIKGRCLRKLKGHRDAVESVVLTRDGKYCISASSDKTVRIWNTKNGLCKSKLVGHNAKIYNIQITPNGKHCVTASKDGVIKIWDLKTGKCIDNLYALSDIRLDGVDLSKSKIVPKEYSRILEQNGAIV